MGDRMDEMKGNVKEGWGKVTGDKDTEAEGRAESDAAEARRETKGAMQEAGGNIKEGVGKVIGNEQMQAEGKADQLKGKGRQAG
jgi:uncharacterized protein YjbJ (UPF0337 family)